MKDLLLDDFLNYQPQGFSKARLVYEHCVRAGKMALAYRIACKYHVDVDYPIQSDMAIATAFSLLAVESNPSKPEDHFRRSLKGHYITKRGLEELDRISGGDHFVVHTVRQDGMRKYIFQILELMKKENITAEEAQNKILKS